MPRQLSHRIAVVLAALILAALAALAAAAPAAPAAPPPPPVAPDPAKLGDAPVRVRDTVLQGSDRARVRARSAALPQPVRASNGELVRVVLSSGYGDDPDLARAWADFFTSLVHGSELQELIAYVAPYSEVQSLCGQGADACYSGVDRTLVVPGSQPPDGVPVEEIAAHEYGHHIARSRSSFPWSALDWGTKRWSTGEAVCQRVRAGSAFPGDEASRYSLNPGEAFADSYRVLVGGNWSGLFDGSFRPGPDDLARIRDDVLQPWPGNATELRKGSFGAAGSSVRSFSFATPLDGRLTVKLRAGKGEDLNLYLYDGKGRRLVSSKRGSRPGVRGDLCGVRRIRVDVRRAGGRGGFRLSVSHA